jgi:hypothetical protein
VQGEAVQSGEVAIRDGAAALLEHAWTLEPAMRLSERAAALGQLAILLEGPHAPPAPPGRDFGLELLAERAVDASIHVRVDEVLELTDQVRAAAFRINAPIAQARATWARGRALAWAGTDAAASEGARELEMAAEQFAALGRREWHGYTLIWYGHTIHYENGRPRDAAEMTRAGLALLPADSPWRSTAMVFLADAQIELGELDDAGVSLNEALLTAEACADAKARSYATWTAAHLAAAREDQLGTARLLAEVEAQRGEWFESHLGLYFLADAAALLDCVGLTDRAARYLETAQARQSANDDYVVLANAVMLARTGDPHVAESTLQEVVRGEWVEKRLRWRNTMLLAWSKLRAGDRTDACRVAARAFEEAHACGGTIVAATAEPLITHALAPLAAEAGSEHARRLLAGDGELIIRLFGTPAVTASDGRTIELPPGMPGELLRMLAIHPRGTSVDTVLATFFPDVTSSTGRQRLRQLLARLRSAGGELVIRDGELLTLAPAWVDLRSFSVLTGRARATRGALAVQYAHAALALAARGPLLPAHPYADWADEARHSVDSALVALGQITGRSA